MPQLALIAHSSHIAYVSLESNLPPALLSSPGECQVLRQEWLRQAANKIAYYDKERFATRDALLVGRLHTYLPGWYVRVLVKYHPLRTSYAGNILCAMLQIF